MIINSRAPGDGGRANVKRANVSCKLLYCAASLSILWLVCGHCFRAVPQNIEEAEELCGMGVPLCKCRKRRGLLA